MSQSQDTGQNSDWGIYDFQISGQSFISKNFRNSSHDIDMKFGPVTKIDKRNTVRSKKFDELDVKTSLSFFRFIANLEQSGSRIPDA